MDKQLMKVVAFLIIVLIAAFTAKHILLDGLKVVELKGAPSLASAVSQGLGVSGSNNELPVYGKDYTLSAVKYFENKTWVVASVVPVRNNADDALIVMKLVDGSYQVVLGPSPTFSNSYAYSLPPDVSSYLGAQGAFHE